MASNNFIQQIENTGSSYLNFYERGLGFVSAQISQPTVSIAGSNTAANIYEQDITSGYIAPQRNKHIFGVKTHGEENSIFFGPNYSYGTDVIPYYEQEVIVYYEGGGSGDYNIYWQDLVRTS